MTTPQDRVAVRLIRLSLLPNGTLPTSYLLEDATRASLLADLALSGAMKNDADAIDLDETPTGFAPADDLLHAIAAKPDRTIDGWLQHGPNSMRDVIEELVGDRTWSRHGVPLDHHYRDVDSAAVSADRSRVAAALRSGRAEPHTAVLATIVDVVGTPREAGGQRPAHRLFDACGPAAWLIGDICGYLLDRRAQLGAAAIAGETQVALNLIW